MFVRMIPGYEVAFTERYNPGEGNAIGQNTSGSVRLGSGDFCMFIPPVSKNNNKIQVNTNGAQHYQNVSGTSYRIPELS